MNTEVRMPRVELGDIKDCEAFVRGVIRRRMNAGARLDTEELVAEGLVILCRLFRAYDPSKERPSTKPGHKCKNERCCQPSFAGYASHLLPPKILDAWHGLHPEHLLRTREDGKRKYVYLDAAVSIDEGAARMEMRDDYNHIIDMPGTRAVGNFIALREAGSDQ